jgi:beta-D-xylosidase 4
LHGVALSPGVSFETNETMFSYATSFANPILMSAAFDDDLIFNVADTVSTEARAFSNAGHAGLDFWTPNINPFKDPRWGRGTEVCIGRLMSINKESGSDANLSCQTPGEDPFRLRGYVKQLLAGLEGNDKKTRKVIATCKHYAAYDLERWKGVIRYGFDAIVPMQDLSE